MIRWRWLALFTLWLPYGCDRCGSSDRPVLYGAAAGGGALMECEDAPDSVSAFTGIYQITAMTQNESGCDGEGTSILADRHEQMLVVRAATPEEARFCLIAIMLSCREEEDCRNKAVAPETAGGEMLYFLSGGSGTTLTGVHLTTGYSGSETCTEAGEYQLRLEHKADSFSFSQRGVKLDYPSAGGLCSTDAVKARAAGKPCNYRLLIEAKRVANI